ncbi:hypothetical protein ACKI1Y_42745 [Streptomyces acidiscabies]
MWRPPASVPVKRETWPSFQRTRMSSAVVLAVKAPAVTRVAFFQGEFGGWSWVSAGRAPAVRPG